MGIFAGSLLLHARAYIIYKYTFRLIYPPFFNNNNLVIK